MAPLKVAFRIRDLRDTDDTRTSGSNIYLIQVAQSDLAFRCYLKMYKLYSQIVSIAITASKVITLIDSRVHADSVGVKVYIV